MSNVFYSSSSSSYASKGVSLNENLAPKTLARVGKEVRDLMKNPPEGCKLIVDPDTGMPYSLNEIMVRFFALLLPICCFSTRLDITLISIRFCIAPMNYTKMFHL